jgi:DNA-binding transcriptional ArsR family regulator
MSLKEKLARYMRNNHGWIAKGAICDLAREKTGSTGENTGRRLRELAEEGLLDVKKVRGHAYYRLAEKVPTLF